MTADALPARDRIIRADHMRVMEEWPDNIIDLTVTSPPYDHLRTYSGYEFRYEDTLAELHRVTKPGGTLVWVVADSMSHYNQSLTSFRQALTAQHIGWAVNPMIWYKDPLVTGSTKHHYFRNFEYMFVMHKGRRGPAVHNILRDVPGKGSTVGLKRRTRAGKLVRSDQSKSSGLVEFHRKPKMIRGRRVLTGPYRKRGAIWYFPTGMNVSTTDKAAFRHPAIFPERLAEDHILSWSNPGDLVLDPMCGSGTVPKVSKQRGRHYIGIDVSQEYVDISRGRLAFEKLAPHVVDRP